MRIPIDIIRSGRVGTDISSGLSDGTEFPDSGLTSGSDVSDTPFPVPVLEVFKTGALIGVSFVPVDVSFPFAVEKTIKSAAASKNMIILKRAIFDKKD